MDVTGVSENKKDDSSATMPSFKTNIAVHAQELTQSPTEDITPGVKPPSLEEEPNRKLPAQPCDSSIRGDKSPAVQRPLSTECSELSVKSSTRTSATSVTANTENVTEAIKPPRSKARKQEQQRRPAKQAIGPSLADMVTTLKEKEEEEQLMKDPDFAGWLPPKGIKIRLSLIYTQNGSV